jgi:hypothetical protein
VFSRDFQGSHQRYLSLLVPAGIVQPRGGTIAAQHACSSLSQTLFPQSGVWHLRCMTLHRGGFEYHRLVKARN